MLRELSQKTTVGGFIFVPRIKLLMNKTILLIVIFFINQEMTGYSPDHAKIKAKTI